MFNPLFQWLKSTIIHGTHEPIESLDVAGQ